jgi:hypothetical protein
MTQRNNRPEFSSIEDRLILVGQRLANDPGSVRHPAQAEIPEWKGADVKVTSDFNWEPEDFIEAHDLLVRTRHASALTWLFFEIRDAFGHWLDASNKYGFYGSLGQAAQKHLAANQPESQDSQPLLGTVLAVAFDWLCILRNEKSIPANAQVLIHSRDAEGRQVRICLKDGHDTL